MKIRELKLQNFRNYAQLSFEPAPGVSVLVGPNGAGKTNILEAVHLCCLGRSHRISQDRDMVRRDCQKAVVSVRTERIDGAHQVDITLTPDEKKQKSIRINGKAAARMGELMGQVNCVLFSPEDLQIIKEGPQLRRRFLDMMISQLHPTYFYRLQTYQSAMRQRNALLRQINFTGKPQNAQLSVFEDQLAAAGVQIMEMRSRYAAMLTRLTSERYRDISGGQSEVFDLRYQTSLEGKTRETLAADYEAGRAEDIRRCTTTKGPHRDDLVMTLEGKEMKLFASQGQIRTAALAIKLSQLLLMEQSLDEAPVLLLDDVMSELDTYRRSMLLESLNGIQTIVSCTDESDLAAAKTERLFHVKQSGGLASVE